MTVYIAVYDGKVLGVARSYAGAARMAPSGHDPEKLVIVSEYVLD